MGKLQAQEMIAHAGQDVALQWHLSANHYPPIPGALLPVCKEAIKLAARDKWDEKIDLPKGIEWRGHPWTTTRAIVEYAHLDTFIEAHLDEADDEGAPD